ncbi:MAG: hypothetical protein JW939_02740 [Candidatus Thermoplasmatota archaeon]|nr:hypothetical protein [Candidatus Thermoplasmatota archaeon]
MAGLDPYWLLSEVLLLITFVLLMITYILLPGKKDILAGVTRIPGWVPAAHVAMFSMAMAIIIISIFLVENNLIILITGILLIVALVLAFIDYFITRAKIGKNAAAGTVHQAIEHADEEMIDAPHYMDPARIHHHDPHLAPAPPPGATTQMITVECPQCGGHIELPVGSHQITCPYCGMSGTM